MELLNQKRKSREINPALFFSKFYFCSTETYKQARARSIALLLDDDGQVHIQVDTTVEMEGAGGVKWSNGHTLTRSVELQVVDDRCIRFSSWFSDVIHPGAIANNV